MYSHPPRSIPMEDMMKTATPIVGAVIAAVFFLPTFQAPSGNESDNAQAGKTTWDLKRDIKADRYINCLPDQGSFVGIGSDMVQFQAPDLHEGIDPDFGIRYPLPRGKKTVTIDMEIKWESSSGVFQILFDTASPYIFDGTGVAFSYESVGNICRSGMTLGRLDSFGTKSPDYKTSSMSLGGGGWKKLQLVLKSGSITCTVDKKTLTWTGKFSPKLIMLSGAEFWCIDVRKFDMRVKMEK